MDCFVPCSVYSKMLRIYASLILLNAFETGISTAAINQICHHNKFYFMDTESDVEIIKEDFENSMALCLSDMTA